MGYRISYTYAFTAAPEAGEGEGVAESETDVRNALTRALVAHLEGIADEDARAAATVDLLPPLARFVTDAERTLKRGKTTSYNHPDAWVQLHPVEWSEPEPEPLIKGTSSERHWGTILRAAQGRNSGQAVGHMTTLRAMARYGYLEEHTHPKDGRAYFFLSADGWDA